MCVKDCHSYNIENLVVHNSGAGSLVNYALGITKINPLEYDLLFERFLNKERGHIPDIDSDFCINKGLLVFKYLNEKYGSENCCNIITFGLMKAKMVIKDVAKALDIPFNEVNDFTKYLPSGPGAEISIDEILTNDKYKNLPFVKKYPEVFKFAKKLENTPRHASQHAAGIAVTPKPVHEIAPVYYGKDVPMPDGTTFKGNRSQLTKEQAENCGIIKLDILKLKNVTELDEECKEISKRYMNGKKFELEDIPLDDKAVWTAFKTFNTKGVFQFSSPIAKPVLLSMQCDNIEELSAATSLIRPGTGGLDQYVEGKKNPKAIRKIDSRLAEPLKVTFGAIIFQE